MDYEYLMTGLSVTGFILGLIFPIGKINKKGIFNLIGLFVLFYIVAVIVGINSIQTSSISEPHKIDYSNPLTLVIVSAFGTLAYFWQIIISYGGGVVIYYIASFIKDRLTFK